MFLIKCEDDSFYCVINDEDVICDKDVVKDGEVVSFFWNKKKFSGVIIMRSGKIILYLSTYQ